MVLDLRKDEGKAVLAKLLERADVLAENFRPGVLAEMGFTEARLEEINPRLIVASINGYGSTGPYADRPSFDFIAQAMSGFMATTGEKDGAPMRAGAPITDLVAGLYCAFGVVNAIRARRAHGARPARRGVDGQRHGVDAGLSCVGIPLDGPDAAAQRQ